MRAWGTSVEVEMRIMELDICATPDDEDFEVSFTYRPKGSTQEHSLLVLNFTPDQLLDLKARLNQAIEMYEDSGYTLPSR